VEETRVRVSSNHFEGIAGFESATRPCGHLYCLNTPFLCSTILQTVSLFSFSRLHARRRRLQGGGFQRGNHRAIAASVDFERHREKKIPANIQKGADASVLESQARKADVESKKESCVQKCEVGGRACREVSWLRCGRPASSRPNPTQNFTSSTQRASLRKPRNTLILLQAA